MNKLHIYIQNIVMELRTDRAKKIFIDTGIILSILIVGISCVFILPRPIQKAILASYRKGQSIISEDTTQVKIFAEFIRKEIVTLDKKIEKPLPKSHFLIINTSSNEFSLYKGHELIKKDKCSTGSYVLLKNGDTQQWMFKTPKGEFKILNKNTSPVWKKPDWAFVEEGMPVPSPNHHSRFEYGVLGDYSLSLGQGYLIHGTLYQRFLGLPVTHGCVRLNDENLELVYRSLRIGSKVYIY